MEHKMVETAMKAIIKDLQMPDDDAAKFVAAFQNDKNPVTAFQSIGINLAILCGFKGEPFEIPDGLDRDCLAVVVERDFSNAKCLVTLRLKDVFQYSGPLDDPKTHEMAKKAWDNK